MSKPREREASPRMEPKTIKEERTDDLGSGGCAKELRQASPPERVARSKAPKERVKTPDSPEGARLMACGVTPSSPPTLNGTAPPPPVPPIPPQTPAAAAAAFKARAAAAAAAARHNAVASYLHATEFDHQIWVQIPGNTSPPLSYSLPEGRGLSKVKRFLSTLVQFGHDISADTGDRVRTLVFSLVSNAINVEEFHQSLQETTNFPLRPFVLPFLRAHLPHLQREVAALARAAKQSPHSYVRHHERAVLEPGAGGPEVTEIFSNADGSGPPPQAPPPVDPATAAAVAVAAKRRIESLYENGDGGDYVSAPKRIPPGAPTLLYPANPIPLGHYHPGAELAYNPYAPPPPPPPAHHHPTHADEEWKNIHVMLNCILSMVEKTKRALAILQHRSGSGSGSGMPEDWPRGTASSGPGSGTSIRGPPNGEESHQARDIKRTAGEIMAQTIRATEDRVAEVKRRAEEAVNEVKRQAVAELQRAVAAAESKACELVATERAKMEKLLLEARKQAAEEAIAAVVGNSGQPTNLSNDNVVEIPSQQNVCWNCGRKANETCSGCNVARYCGAFCQHKDWENHHQVCDRQLQQQIQLPPHSRSSSRSNTPSTPATTTPATNTTTTGVNSTSTSTTSLTATSAPSKAEPPSKTPPIKK